MIYALSDLALANIPGRSGPGQVWLSSPDTVAAIALACDLGRHAAASLPKALSRSLLSVSGVGGMTNVLKVGDDREAERQLLRRELVSATVKVFGCWPVRDGADAAMGPAFGNLQVRKA